MEIIHKSLKFDTFEEAFVRISNHIVENPEFLTSSRIGEVAEITNLSYEINEADSFQFRNENIGRLSYDYAEKFYEWMMSGSTDHQILIKDYPGISKFLEKPKHPDLPPNFNTFYGPRILSQLPKIEKELKERPDTRRAVISILYPQDLNLLDKIDETLEFPCCDSSTFFIREGKLNIHVHMRSQNMGQVLKLDMYLWGRFLSELSLKLNLPIGKFSSSIVSAHVFTRDFEYIKSLI